MPADPCPPRGRLLAFHTGDLPPHAIDRVAAHVERCRACEAALAALDGSPDELAGDLLGAAPGPSTAVWLPPAVAAGTVVGDRYTLVAPLGEGGMGAVWRADQAAPVRRPVAVKLIKPGLAGRPVLARFEAERQALARMDHPNIARVLDAGATAAGRPFFVMELVEGPPITRYCRDRRVPLRDRLGLFVQVCQAVQHAHQKGVIHRDLKPSNVLVAVGDGAAVPKVIDFGVAKAAGAPLTDLTLETGVGAVIGTPEYMAPEQAEPGQSDIDTRADVYALGVLLYELLTGSPPLTRERLAAAALLEVLRLVREDEPPRPSARLAAAPRLARAVRGELDWIVMKAIEKDRGRRYETAFGLARDVERYLTGEPVQAAPPGVWYRAGKVLRRHRGPAIATALVVAGLVAGSVGTTVGLVRARQALADKDDALRIADDQRRVAAAVAEFLTEDVLAQADSRAQARRRFDPDPALTVRTAVDRAAATVGDRFGGRPEVEAAVRRAIGGAYVGCGEPGKAVAHLERAADLDRRAGRGTTVDAVAGLVSLADAYRDARRPADAVRVAEEVVAVRERALGPAHPDTLAVMGLLAHMYGDAGRFDDDYRLLDEVRDRTAAVRGPDHPETLRAGCEALLARGAADRIAAAVPAFERVAAAWAADHGPDHPDTLKARSSLGRAYQSAGRYADAERVFTALLDAETRVNGPTHGATLYALGSLAMVYEEAGRNADAIAVYERARAGLLAGPGADHPAALRVGKDLAGAYRTAGRAADARRLLEELAPRAARALGADHPESRATDALLAQVRETAGR